MFDTYFLNPKAQKENELRQSLEYDIRQLDYEDLKKIKELSTELSKKRSDHYFLDEASITEW